jgi:hypothetical protein
MNKKNLPAWINEGQVTSLIRWVMTMASGYMVSKGYQDASTGAAAIALAPGIASMVWSWFVHDPNYPSVQ